MHWRQRKWILCKWIRKVNLDWMANLEELTYTLRPEESNKTGHWMRKFQSKKILSASERDWAYIFKILEIFSLRFHFILGSWCLIFLFYLNVYILHYIYISIYSAFRDAWGQRNSLELFFIRHYKLWCHSLS